jgi:hypothetical protein
MKSVLAMITLLGDERPDNSLPGQPPGIWGPNDPRPSNPIAPGGLPPGYWGGVAPPWVSHPIAPGGRPGYPSHPIAPGGERPSHPIWITPPDYWGGVAPPLPTHPIELPPPEGGGEPLQIMEWTTGWSAETGWVVIGIPADGTLVPTPSKKK